MKLKTILVAGAALAATATVAHADTLADVKARGELNCIVTTGLVGFAYTDENGQWRGFDADFCRATAAAIFGDGSKVKFVPTTGKTRFTALNAGEGDILYRNTTETMSRDVDLKLSFLGINYYDGQGFMVKKDLGVTSAKELNGASVCIQTGTTTELNLADYFRANDMSYEPVPIETNDEARANYLSGRCDVYTTDASGLAATRASLDDPKNHIVLPEIISKEPLGPAVRQGDEAWGDLTRWVLRAVIAAEEYGVTQENVAELSAGPTGKPDVDRLLGTEGNFGEMIGLGNDWAANAIKAVGNYGEIFDRNIGPNTELGIERGLNAQWYDGGLMYAAPIR
ncbi:amino acid ABC transporter substrate-binding protein [Rhodospirillaceae bacterium KN72]|uniref:Amino acid ABC transporter substrate-binding protein n=1 Tax=Pacificispira spongiicola TaxID=2729598 RepID=A0A7Y0DZF1_9PROT|nr:amino acid ABC transporter substrate-binding protein [Pacificispira spongiicola]NMM44399.1 amino acid ABC transporter substrate-binding protein [Pacificispira spongiicola]